MRKGFSLVELAVVVLIIGLLVAGVSSGAQIVEQAKIRGLISDAESIKAAHNTFITTYGDIPGDMTDADVFFTNCAETAANCNGNNDGTLTWSADTDDEVYKAMLHLNRAELLDNNIAQLANAHDGTHIGQFVKSNYGTSHAFYVGGKTTDVVCQTRTGLFENNLGVYFGSANSGVCYSGPGLSADEAYNIDKKIDDGDTQGQLAIGFNTGKFRAGEYGTPSNDCYNVANTGYNIGNALSTCFIGFQL